MKSQPRKARNESRQWEKCLEKIDEKREQSYKVSNDKWFAGHYSGLCDAMEIVFNHKPKAMRK